MSVVGQAFVEILPVSTGFASALERQIKTAADKAAKNSSGIVGSLAGVGKAVTFGLTGAAAAVSAVSVKMASDFQSASVHLVTDAGEAAKNLGLVQSGMLAISQQTGTTAADIVNGMYHIESAGYHGAQGLAILKAAAEGAKVGGADLDTVSKTLTGTMRSYNIPAGQAVNVMNELIAAVGSGDMRMQDLATSLGNVTPVAASAGLSLAQVTGAIATMTAQNMSAQQASQDVANTIRAIQAPSKSAIQEMAQFGLNANTVSTQLGKKGLTGTLGELTQAILSKMGPSGMVMLNAFNQSQGAAQDMQIELSKMPPHVAAMAKSFMDGQMSMAQWRKAAKGLPADQRLMMQGFMQTYSTAHRFNDILRSGSPAAQTYNASLQKMLGGATGLNTALMLTGANFGEFTKNVNTVAAAAAKGGQNVDNWAMIQKTFAQQMSQLKVTIDDLLIRLGLRLIPVVEAVARAFASATTWLESHKAAAIALASVVGGILTTTVAAFTAVTMARMFRQVKDGIKIFRDLGARSIEIIGNIGKFMLANPWLIAIAAVAAAAYLIITHWKQVSAFFERLWHDVSGFFVSLWHDIYGGFIRPLVDTWDTTVASLEGAWSDVASAVSGAFSAAMGYAHSYFLDPVVSAFHATVGAITGAFSAVGRFFAKWWPIMLPLAMTLFLGPLGIVVGVIVDEIILHWHRLMSIVTDVLHASHDVEVVVWHAILDVVRTVGGAILAVVSVAWGAVSAVTRVVFDALRVYFEAWWTVAHTIFTVAFGVLSAAFSVAWSAIRAVTMLVFDGLKAYFEVWWTVVSAAFRIAVAVVEAVLRQAWADIDAAARLVWDGLTTFFKIWWDVLKGLAVAGWDLVKGIFNVALDLIEGKWSKAWGAVKSTWDGIWSAITGSLTGIWNSISGFFTSALGTFSTWWSTTWGTIAGAFSSIWNGVAAGAAGLWDTIKGAFVTGINDVIDVINVFIKALDIIPGVSSILKPLSHVGGGAGHPGNRAGQTASAATALAAVSGIPGAAAGMIVTSPMVLVGEGRRGYPETVIPWDPMHRDRAHDLLAATIGAIGLPGLKGGGIWNDITGVASSVAGDVTGLGKKLAGLFGEALAAAAGPVVSGAEDIAFGALSGVPNPVGAIGRAGVKSVGTALLNWLKGTTSPAGGVPGGPLPAGAHLLLVKQALAAAGIADTGANEAAVNLIVTHESGWNPNAINNWDINAKNGDPSRGLMQTIGTTFEAYRLQSLPDNIYDPLANLVAGIRYAVTDYGSLTNVPGVRAVAAGGSYVGYDSGGPLPPGLTMAVNGTGSAEYVLRPSGARSASAPQVVFGQGAVQINVGAGAGGVDLAAVEEAAQRGMEKGMMAALGSAVNY